VFLGAVAARNKKAVLSSPGGCELGPRPIDIHISALRELGLKIEESYGLLMCDALSGLRGNEITLSFPSVGATENIILAASTAKGKTVIHNAAKEPEISDLADFLNSAGADIQGAGSDRIEIIGVSELHETEHTVIPDRIEAATYLSAAAITGGKITLQNTVPAHLTPILSTLKAAGCSILIHNRNVTLTAPVRLKRIPIIRTLPYPGFPTDAGSPIIAMLTVADGSSMFVENIFENRYRVVDEFNRMGAKITTNGRVAVIEGVHSLTGAAVECTDLRGGAALVVAALAAKGTTNIGKIHHIERGYENFVQNLSRLGADVVKY
jgi:UDP-N-acetylglucosamine 1-carboxyvinyltransferase